MSSLTIVESIKTVGFKFMYTPWRFETLLVGKIGYVQRSINFIALTIYSYTFAFDIVQVGGSTR